LKLQDGRIAGREVGREGMEGRNGRPGRPEGKTGRNVGSEDGREDWTVKKRKEKRGGRHHPTGRRTTMEGEADMRCDVPLDPSCHPAILPSCHFSDFA
jgi:hypothetical protein